MTEQYKYIEKLVERFLDGATTHAEEKELYAFFTGKDIPPHLEQYAEMFAWFDSGMPHEFETVTEPAPKIIRPKNRFRIWGTVAAVAATLVLLMVLRPRSVEPEFDPFEGSYIVRNGVKITDPELVGPEIENTLRLIEEQEQEMTDFLYTAYQGEIDDIRHEQNRKKEWIDFINDFPEGEARLEVIDMLINTK